MNLLHLMATHLMQRHWGFVFVSVKSITLVFMDISQSYQERIAIVRFIAIWSIVWGHCLFGFDSQSYSLIEYRIIQSTLMELGKVGTELFFIISGFLMSDKISRFSLLGYTRYRMFSLIVPWFIFLSIYVLIQASTLISFSQIIQGDFTAIMSALFSQYKELILYSVYWYIPASILIMFILILLKKQLDKPWLGITFALLIGLYNINLYCGWLPINHIKAFVLYTFFMWFGIQMKRNLITLSKTLDRISWTALIVMLIVAFILAGTEGMMLKSMSRVDSFSSLRLFNSILSILIFLSILKSDKLLWIKKLDLHQYVYGVYLIHVILSTLLFMTLNKYMPLYKIQMNFPCLILVQFLSFAGVITTSFIIVKAISRSPLYFLLGRHN